MVANVQVVQPLRQRTAGPLGCSWGAQAERTPLVSLCVVLVSVFTLCICIPNDAYFAVALLNWNWCMIAISVPFVANNCDAPQHCCLVC